MQMRNVCCTETGVNDRQQTFQYAGKANVDDKGEGNGNGTKPRIERRKQKEMIPNGVESGE